MARNDDAWNTGDKRAEARQRGSELSVCAFDHCAPHTPFLFSSSSSLPRPQLQMNGFQNIPRDDKLPPIPPSDHGDPDHFTPTPPPKLSAHPPPIDTDSSLAIPELGTSSFRRLATCPDHMHHCYTDPTQPMTPITPTGLQPPRSPAADGKPKKVNPLTDLVETEKIYVDLLTGVIRVSIFATASLLPSHCYTAILRSTG